MADMERIVSARPTADGVVELAFANGSCRAVDFKPVIARGNLFARLADPAFFALVKVAPNGRYLVWPDDLEFCADALLMSGERLEAEPVGVQSSPPPSRPARQRLQRR